MRFDLLQPTASTTRLGLWFAAAVMLAAGCASSRIADPNAPVLHPRLTHSAYIEEGDLVIISVDTVAGSRARKESFISLPFLLANKTNRDMRFSSESFVLVDRQGRTRPLASYEEVRDGYRRQRIDETYSKPFYEAIYQRLEINDRFPAYMRGPFPLFGKDRLRNDNFTVGGNGYVEGVLYFPRREGESLEGAIFDLELRSQDLQEPIFVRFKFP